MSEPINTKFSRRRPRSKGPFKESYVRTTMNQVSGLLEHTILDDVQIAYEHAVREFARFAKFNGDQFKYRRFLEKCVFYCLTGLMWNGNDQTEIGRVRELCLSLADRCELLVRILYDRMGKNIFEGDGEGI